MSQGIDQAIGIKEHSAEFRPGREETLAQFRKVRDEIKASIAAWLAKRPKQQHASV